MSQYLYTMGILCKKFKKRCNIVVFIFFYLQRLDVKYQITYFKYHYRPTFYALLLATLALD